METLYKKTFIDQFSVAMVWQFPTFIKYVTSSKLYLHLRSDLVWEESCTQGHTMISFKCWEKKKKFVCEVSNFLRLITFELQVWLMETLYRWKENFITFPITLKLHKMGDHRGNQRGAQNQGKHQRVPKNTRKLKEKKKREFSLMLIMPACKHYDRLPKYFIRRRDTQVHSVIDSSSKKNYSNHSH